MLSLPPPSSGPSLWAAFVITLTPHEPLRLQSPFPTQKDIPLGSLLFIEQDSPPLSSRSHSDIKTPPTARPANAAEWSAEHENYSRDENHDVLVRFPKVRAKTLKKHRRTRQPAALETDFTATRNMEISAIRVEAEKAAVYRLREPSLMLAEEYIPDRETRKWMRVKYGKGPKRRTRKSREEEKVKTLWMVIGQRNVEGSVELYWTSQREDGRQQQRVYTTRPDKTTGDPESEVERTYAIQLQEVEVRFNEANEPQAKLKPGSLWGWCFQFPQDEIRNSNVHSGSTTADAEKCTNRETGTRFGARIRSKLKHLDRSIRGSGNKWDLEVLRIWDNYE